MPLQQVTAPSEEPISLLEAKLHLRVDFDEDDALITTLIGAARQAAETLTGRQFVTARWKLVLDGFPGFAVLLPKSPVQSIVGIEYLDTSGVLQTLPADEYTVDAACEPARITPVFGKAWPPCLPQIGAVAVTFDVGYGSAFDVPDGIKAWIKLRVGSLYGCREELSATARTDTSTSSFFNGLLDPFRVVCL